MQHHRSPYIALKVYGFDSKHIKKIEQHHRSTYIGKKIHGSDSKHINNTHISWISSTEAHLGPAWLNPLPQVPALALPHLLRLCLLRPCPAPSPRLLRACSAGRPWSEGGGGVGEGAVRGGAGGVEGGGEEEG